MEIIRDQSFHSLYDLETGRVIEDTVFTGCTFSNSFFSTVNDQLIRSTIRRCRFENCRTNRCTIGPALVQDVVVENLRSTDEVIVRAAIFEHVTLKGRIDKLLFRGKYRDLHTSPELTLQINQETARYLETVDWSLDIREAQFKECDISNLLFRLVRRDPETQVVIRRDMLLDGRWRDVLGQSHEFVSFVLKIFIESGSEEYILVAPRRGDYRPTMQAIEALRKAGIIAE